MALTPTSLMSSSVMFAMSVWDCSGRRSSLKSLIPMFGMVRFFERIY